MRKWRPSNAAAAADEWQIVKQVVVPSSYRAEILRLVHDGPFAGHLGVNKTYDRVIQKNFLAWFKKRCSYCRSCHVCQKKLENRTKLFHLLHSIQLQLLVNHLTV